MTGAKDDSSPNDDPLLAVEELLQVVVRTLDEQWSSEHTMRNSLVAIVDRFETLAATPGANLVQGIRLLRNAIEENHSAELDSRRTLKTYTDAAQVQASKARDKQRG